MEGELCNLVTYRPFIVYWQISRLFLVHCAIALWLYLEERLAPNDNSRKKEMEKTQHKKSRNVNFTSLEVEVLRVW